jgi:RND superfamily putative drug exporter
VLLRLGEFVARRPWRFLLLHLVLLACAVPVVPDVLPHLKGGGFEDDDAESWSTKALIETELGQGPAEIVALYRAPEGSTVDDVVVLGEVLAAATRVAADPLAGAVDSFYTTGAPWLVSHDRTRTVVIVTLKGAEHEKQQALPRLRALLAVEGGVTVEFTGITVINEAVASVIEHDLVQGELYALPLTLLVLLWVFRGVVAAGLPLLMGICANVAAFACLRLLTVVTEVSVFAANIVTLLALGLAIDCSLFVVTRFREELRAQALRGEDDAAHAVAVAMDTAGRAVFFSGAVVALSMIALCTMPQMLIKSLGYAGVVVVCSTLLLMMFFLPAVLALLGKNVERLPLPFFARSGDARDGAFFFALAHKVMRRPVVVVVAVGALLLVLAAPFARMVPSVPDYKALPRGNPVREATESFNAQFLPNQLTPHDVVITLDGDVFSAESLGKLVALQARLEHLPGVIGVQSPFSIGDNVQAPMSRAAVVDLLLTRRDRLDPTTKELLSRFLKGHLARMLVLSRESYNTTETLEQVRQIRALSVDGHPLRVAGAPAVLVDLLQRLGDRAPFALGFVGVAMFFVLAVAFRSVVVPLKAIVMNCLSMTASFGALVWVFQDGRFADLLRYEPPHFTDATTPLVMFCLVFGLSMDYEVLLLGRVREEAVKNGGNTEDAVAVGLQRTGRTITSAALLLIVVVGAFGFSQVLTMKQLGLGIALSVLLDATVVRAVLVPATMKLLGNLNWWPGGLK